ncbi:nuclear transcription factor Y subunit B-8-like [Abrus precatorius]|uniref:Nuclear transcription factor Y subunit B-8-like n=1 Tax=Abrus precatorius TaxID=3816 RepID=A0A8B8KDP6_ABRPR|nr:nuclear transcription factor Y subunit B-8-like [Abrus precatorius]
MLNNGNFSLVGSGSIIPLQQSNAFAKKETSTPINSSNHGLVPNLVATKVNMPISNVTKIMRQILPINAKISESAKEMIQQCVTKYIAFVTKKAKERCQSDYRKIMNVEDLLWALEELGFDDYVGPLTVFLQRYREEPILPSVKQSIDNSGPITGPEAGTKPTVEIVQPSLSPPLGSSGPDFSMDPNSKMEIFDPNDINEVINGFYMDGFDVGSLDSALTNFDPSSSFKHD